MLTIFTKKNFLFFSLFFILSFIKVKGQTLHFIIATQSTDANTISQQDKMTMQTLGQEIQQNIPGLNVKTILLDGSQISKVRIEQELSSGIGSNDIVWYYYSGHGENYDTWPMSEEEVPLTWVHNKLKAIPAKLTIAMYDCSNHEDSLVPKPNDLHPRSSYYKFLFLESKGNIIVANCSSTRSSFGSPSTGSLFTNSFIDALRSQSNWENVLKTAKQNTSVSARERNKTQIPIYDIQIDTANPVAAPVIRTKRYNSLEEVAKAMTRANGGEIVEIKDIQRWNPGVTRSNFRSFTKLKFNPNDPLLGEDDYPIFSFPCPNPSCAEELPLELLMPNLINQDNIKLRDIHNGLNSLLKSSGYHEKRYFRTEDNKGFVLTTKLERIDKEDATPKKKRFQQGKTKLTLDNFSFKEYLSQLLFSKKGHYRIFVFVVSKGLSMKTEKREDAKKIMSELSSKGSLNLSHDISEEKIVINKYNCNVLVYEIEENEQTGELAIVENSKFQAQDHLKAAGIYRSKRNKGDKCPTLNNRLPFTLLT